MNRQEWHGRPRRKRTPRISKRAALLLAASCLLLVIGIIGIVHRASQDSAARQAAEELRSAAGEETRIPTLSPAPASAVTETPETEPAETAAAAAALTAAQAPETKPTETAAAAVAPTAAPTPTPIPRLEEQFYPAAPETRAGDRFRTLQQENRDIIGWLTVGKIIDEPVVQRDNIFYMDHDVRKESNINGAIFLDENISLKTRPWGLILYGHNMRSGGMFGRLSNYDKASFYRSNPILTFDTAYEDGRYVIFAAGIVNVEDESAENFLDFFGITTRNIHEREQAIETLKKITPYDCGVDAGAEDQLLLLVTCDGKDEERRIVAARRIRDGESEESLKEGVNGAQ